MNLSHFISRGDIISWALVQVINIDENKYKHE